MRSPNIETGRVILGLTEPRVRKRRPKQYPLMQTPRKELRMLLANNTVVD
jgi:hypothetical protein